MINIVMKKCNHCEEIIETKNMANHVRWHHQTNTIIDKHKFLLFCSCLVCHSEISTQGLNKHILSHVNKSIIKTHCKHCSLPIYDKSKTFCGASCSAKYHNTRRIRTQEYKDKVSKALSGRTLSEEARQRRYSLINNGKYAQIPKYKTLIMKTCIVCSESFSQYANKSSQTCSKICSNKHHSIIMKEKIKNGYNPNKHRGRHKRSYMETSFESWLNVEFSAIKYETEHPFKSSMLNKTFFVDFFFEELKLAIELDGTQHNKTVEYDSVRDSNILLEHGVYVYRISHKEYRSGILIPEVINILSMIHSIK